MLKVGFIASYMCYILFDTVLFLGLVMCFPKYYLFEKCSTVVTSLFMLLTDCFIWKVLRMLTEVKYLCTLL